MPQERDGFSSDDDDEYMSMDGGLFSDSDLEDYSPSSPTKKVEDLVKHEDTQPVANEPDSDFRQLIFNSLALKAKKLEDKHLKQRKLWKISASHARLTHHDLWKEINLVETQKARRFRYSPRKGVWTEDIIMIKIQKEPFNHGAMRECFLAKKLSNFSTSTDWSSATVCVVKRYMSDDVDPKSLFDDVRLQMDAKLWGEEFNHHQPPKKVDIMQMSVIEMFEEPNKPLYHLENYIEGDYIKYNSNSGFVSDEARATPQAFSHFTFECSQHRLIVVDIQGVGDLWTDPQIHTHKGTEYGTGNLGTKGMALFFYSHRCNQICQSLNLSSFDLSPFELRLKDRNVFENRRETVPTGHEEPLSSAFHSFESDCIHEELYLPPRSPEGDHLVLSDRRLRDSLRAGDDNDYIKEDSDHQVIRRSRSSTNSDVDSIGYGSVPRIRTITVTSDHSDYHEMLLNPPPVIKPPEENERSSERKISLLHPSTSNSHFHRRASCFLAEKQIEFGKSILGKIHYDMVIYYDCDRFQLDFQSAVFHLQIAADCGCLSAIQTAAKIFLGLPHDLISQFQIEDTEQNRAIGFNYLLLGSKAGDREAIFTVAKSFYTGQGLPVDRKRDWKKSLELFDRLLHNEDEYDAEGQYDSVLSRLAPKYEILEYKAHIYLKGGDGVTKDRDLAAELYNEAAEIAMMQQKGKLATKYYELAEEVYCDE